MKLIIKCDQLVGQADHILLSRLADQINFFPSFGFLSQASTLMDALITATTGAKAGLSSTKEGEITKILECLTIAISEIVQNQKDLRFQAIKEYEKSVAESVAPGEPLPPFDYSHIPEVTFPVIVIDDFMDKMTSRGSYIYDMLTQWASSIAEYRIAHIVFVSDNPAAVRAVSKFLPNKSLETFHLYDAKPQSALDYLRNRLGPKIPLSELQYCVDSLGGRFYDLDLLIQKISSGTSPKGISN